MEVINYNQKITNLSQIVKMGVPCCFKVLIFILVSECSSFKNERDSTHELALDEGLMKIDLLGITIAVFGSVLNPRLFKLRNVTSWPDIQTVMFPK